MVGESENPYPPVLLGSSKMELCATHNVTQRILVLVQFAGLNAKVVCLILASHVKRSHMVDLLASQSIPALQDMRKMELFAIQIASLVSMESDLCVGSHALLVGLTLERSARNGHILMEKAAVVQSSVAAITVQVAILIMVAHAQDLCKV
jgi:hypothetical protein